MTYAPQTIAALAAYWRGQGGVNLGIVGDAAHQARPSYHNGQDVITAHHRTAGNDYSIRHVRDREPYLTNAAAALDLGKLDGSLRELQRFSTWLVERCKAKASGTGDIREIIWSPDGIAVLRWDGYLRRTYTGGTGTGHGDDSHRWHTHISFPRDAEKRTKVGLFAPYFVPDTGTEDDMGLRLQLTATDSPSAPWTAFATARVNGPGHWAIRVADMVGTALADGLDLGVVQYGSLLQPLEAQMGRPPIAGDRTSIVATDINGELHVVLRSDITTSPLAPPPADIKHTVTLASDGQVVYTGEV